MGVTGNLCAEKALNVSIAYSAPLRNVLYEISFQPLVYEHVTHSNNYGHSAWRLSRKLSIPTHAFDKDGQGHLETIYRILCRCRHCMGQRRRQQSKRAIQFVRSGPVSIRRSSEEGDWKRLRWPEKSTTSVNWNV